MLIKNGSVSNSNMPSTALYTGSHVFLCGVCLFHTSIGPSDRESTTPTYDKVSSSSVSFERSAVACGGAFNAVEWKKQNDLLKQAKEQAERKVCISSVWC